jgi:hypothetical protein
MAINIRLPGISSDFEIHSFLEWPDPELAIQARQGPPKFVHENDVESQSIQIAIQTTSFRILCFNLNMCLSIPFLTLGHIFPQTFSVEATKRCIASSSACQVKDSGYPPIKRSHSGYSTFLARKNFSNQCII